MRIGKAVKKKGGKREGERDMEGKEKERKDKRREGKDRLSGEGGKAKVGSGRGMRLDMQEVEGR